MNVQRTRRGGRRKAGLDAPVRHATYRNLTNPFPSQPLYSDDQIDHIHKLAKQILQEIGVRALLPRARDAYRKAGCLVDDDTMMVRIGDDVIERAVASAPNEFTLQASDRQHNIHLGGKSLNFMPVGGPPAFSDLDHGKQTGTRAAAQNFMKLCQHFDVMHVAGACVEAQDLAGNERHLWVKLDNLTLTSKPVFTWARGTPQSRDGFEMIRIARKLSEDEFKSAHHTYTVINTNSPLQLDIPMLNGLMDFAEQNQVVVITPFTLSGAMAPVTIAGALVQQHAEFLAALVINQLVRPGAPVVYGAFTSNVDMKSGAPAFGTPEYVRAAWGSGQLARKLGFPWRSSAPNASNAPDAQGAYETQLSLWGAIQGGSNFIAHTAGWLEGGLTASFEKFILDIEVLQMVAELCAPAKFDESELALDAIREVGPGGHFFGCEHTMERYATAFYSPLVSDWSNFGQWTENGSKTADERANTIWKKIIAEFEPPAMEQSVQEALDDYVARRISEGGALPEIVRLVPDIALPRYAHVPTTGTVPDPESLELAKRLAPPVMLAAEWQKNKAYLYGHDLMRAGFYWEAHEVWEAVWQVTRANSPERVLLQALIQGANAQLKRKMGRLGAAGRLDIQMEELRIDLFARLGGRVNSFMGVSIVGTDMRYIA